jgi:hypothetical protein
LMNMLETSSRFSTCILYQYMSYHFEESPFLNTHNAERQGDDGNT